MSEPLVLQAQQGAVMTVTLNRPQALNSFTGAMHDALLAILQGAAADRSVRCLVLTGAGRAFCAGQDLADLDDAGGAPVDVGAVVEQRYIPLALRLRSMPFPVIAAVNGVAAGAGASLALGCDMVLAAQSASFVQAFARIGLVPDAGGTWLLPRLVGRARALGLGMTGDKLTAEQAGEVGLIWKCIPDAEFQVAVREAAERLAALPTAALAATRAAIDAASGMSFEAALHHEAVLQRQLGAANDFREGVAAFKAKRPAVFSDR